MPVIFALILTFLIGLILRLRGISVLLAWILSCCVMPVFVLFAEFVLPYMGGGASMWPIAPVVGGFYGFIIGGLGVAIASFYLRRKNEKT